MDKKLNRNKNQHYVPENYFMEFSQDSSSICALFKKSGKIRDNVSFKEQSSDGWFYGNAEREDEITKFDTKYFNNRNKILENLTNGASSLLPEQIATLLENTQFQRKRTLTFRKAEQGVHDFHENFFASQVEDLENYDSGQSDRATEAVKEAMKLFIKAFSDPKDSQFNSLMIIDADAVSDLELVIFRNRTSFPFIFSDSPVVYTNPALSDFNCSKFANENVGLQIFYPLNPEFLVLFYDSSVYKLGDPSSLVIDINDDNDISQINKLQLHEAENSIYFDKFKYSEYVKNLWNEENINFKPKEKSVYNVPELTADGYITGREILSIAESEPGFYPSLSFVTSDLSKSHIPYRKAYWRKIIPPGAEIIRYNDHVDRYLKSKE